MRFARAVFAAFAAVVSCLLLALLLSPAPSLALDVGDQLAALYHPAVGLLDISEAAPALAIEERSHEMRSNSYDADAERYTHAREHVAKRRAIGKYLFARWDTSSRRDDVAHTLRC